MKRHSSLIPLSHDHHMTLLLAQVIKKDGPLYKGMSTNPADKADYIRAHYNGHLVKHFETEENILFPFIKGRDKEMDVLIEELISDHRNIARLVSSLNETNLVEALNELGDLLDVHIRKEERILFEKIPQLFSADELIQLEKRIPKSDF
jgi:iron-sulfur cluster repair protein YtfE (RIC family)